MPARPQSRQQRRRPRAVTVTADLQSYLLPAAGLGVALAGVAALRLNGYSRLEYVTAAMLSRHVKRGGARVLQLGGSTRDLFYYPEGTLQVTVGGPQVGAMWEQAGVQAKVPVVAVTADVQKVLSSQAGSTLDSVVLLNQLQQWADVEQLLAQVYRILKPGGTLVFIQRLRGGPLQGLLGGGGGVEPGVVDSVQQYAGWDFAQLDALLEDTDPHAVGVAIKPLSAGAGSGGAAGSVDAAAFEQLMRRGGKAKQKQQQQQQGGGFGTAR
ncbi:hypothetical protein D9Q98_010641 [Chlorella vulgaris]|uniref:Methyltransferase type 11 domain-containing protein n=1 Tax=Chlorella vulgaris TaxID=3077 RepID=A0A9D4YS24_CHLVU|nr:hypothetical protein D9Q98_010641 [Chlorella vulgaris]